MFIYLFILLLLYLFSKVKTNNKKIYMYIYFFEIVILGVILLFRKNGVDYSSYKLNFLNNYNYSDIGFNYLNRYIYTKNLSYQVLIIISSIIAFSFLLMGLNNFKMNNFQKIKYLFIYVLTSGYFMYMNTFKQAISISIFFFTIKFIIKGNYIKYIVYMYISSLFHSSSLLLMPLYFLKKINIRIWSKVLIVILLIINTRIKVFKHILVLIIKKTNLNYVNYLTQDKFGEAYLKIGLLLILEIVILFYFDYLQNKNLLKIKNKMFNKQSINILSNIYFIGIVFNLLKSELYILYRMSDYFILVKCLIIFLILENKKKFFLNKFIKVFFMVSFFLLFIKNLYEDHYGIVPYKYNYKIIRN